MEAYDTDELNYHGGLRVSFGIQLMNAVTRIEGELSNITWPFFILHGDADKLCDIRGSHLMYNEAKSTDKKLKVNLMYISKMFIALNSFLNFKSILPPENVFVLLTIFKIKID